MPRRDTSAICIATIVYLIPLGWAADGQVEGRREFGLANRVQQADTTAQQSEEEECCEDEDDKWSEGGQDTARHFPSSDSHSVVGFLTALTSVAIGAFTSPALLVPVSGLEDARASARASSRRGTRVLVGVAGLGGGGPVVLL